MGALIIVKGHPLGNPDTRLAPIGRPLTPKILDSIIDIFNIFQPLLQAWQDKIEECADFQRLILLRADHQMDRYGRGCEARQDRH